MTARARPDPPPSTPPVPDAEQRPGDGGERADGMAVEVIAVTDPASADGRRGNDGHGGLGMRIEVVPIASLSPNPANVRLHEPRSIDGIAGALRRFKQQKPLVVDQDGVVRAGNGTLAAAKQLGWTEIAIVRTTLTGTELVAYEIADNRLAELSTWDDSGLERTLRALQYEDFDLGAVGFSDAEVDALFGTEGGEVVDDPQAEWKGMPEFEHQDLTPFRTLHIHFRSAEDVQRFGSLIGQDIGENARFLWYPEQQPIPFEKMRYVNESEIPDLHHLEGTLGRETAAHEQGH